MSAERAWAQAMEFKEEQEQNPRARHHSLARLEKSARWTRSLATVRPVASVSLRSNSDPFSGSCVRPLELKEQN
jgi:hypothetical protein